MDSRFLFRGKVAGTDRWAIGTHYVIPAPPQCVGQPEPDAHYIVLEKPGTSSDWGMPRQMVRVEVIPNTVGQCTGLSAAKSYRGDKSEDLMVWEHDRIKCHGKEFSNHCAGTVYWSDEQFKYIVCFDNGAVEQLGVFWRIPCEIIGTIHDTDSPQREKE